MEEAQQFETHADVVTYITEHVPTAERQHVLEQALCSAADFQVWVDRTTGFAWWSAPEIGDSPPILLYKTPAGEAADIFEEQLWVFGYLDRVGDGTGQEYVQWADDRPYSVDVDDDYEVLHGLWQLFRIDAEQRASEDGPTTGLILDRQLRHQQRQLRLKLGYLQARRAYHVRDLYGTDRGWLAAAARDLNLSSPTVHEFVANADKRRETQTQALTEWRQTVRDERRKNEDGIDGPR